MEPQLYQGSRDSALHLPVEPGGVPVPFLFSLFDHCRRALPRPRIRLLRSYPPASRRTRSRDADPLSRLTGELAQRIRKVHVGTSVAAVLPNRPTPTQRLTHTDPPPLAARGVYTRARSDSPRASRSATCPFSGCFVELLRRRRDADKARLRRSYCFAEPSSKVKLGA